MIVEVSRTVCVTARQSRPPEVIASLRDRDTGP
jgi:hypothetical protein